MTKTDYKELMTSAASRCKEAGGRLTIKREQILKVLLFSDKPLSAYETLALYKQQTQASMHPMSVYRILEFLEQQQLIHKLGSQNKFVACAHIHKACHHHVSQFLICRDCQSVKEIHIAQPLIDELDSQAKSVGYQLLGPQLYLDCICAKCASNQ